MLNLENVHHRLFGPGFVFGQREVSVGPVLDVWFIRDEKTRTVLLEEQYWTEPIGEPDFSKQKLRSAYAQWKRLHAPFKPGVSSDGAPKETTLPNDDCRDLQPPPGGERSSRLYGMTDGCRPMT